MTRKITTRLLWVFCLSIIGMSQSFAQIEVEPALSNPLTPENLIREVFAGKGVDILNVTFTGENKSIGYFKNGLNDVGLSEGFIMTTGWANLAATSNSDVGSGTINNIIVQDPLVVDLAFGEQVLDLGTYEIEFIPKGDSIQFDYVFASEEYPEFGCDCFNDVFGFFLQGPGYPDWTNLAIVPGTLDEPVSVRSIHPLDDIDNRTDNCLNGAPRPDCAPTNEHLYINNTGSPTLTYDGLTTVLTAKTKVEACQTYKLRLSIADVNDFLFDSAVFFDAQSFSTDELEVDVDLESINGTLIEGCAGAEVTFKFNNPVEQNYRFEIIGSVVRDNPSITGDYTLEPAQDFIKKGESSLTLEIRPLEDSVDEVLDSLGFDIVLNDCGDRDTIWFYFSDNQIEPVDLGEDGFICPGDSLQLVGESTVVLPEEMSFPYLGTPLIEIVTIDDSGTSTNTQSSVFPIEVSDVKPPDIRNGLIKEVCVNISHPKIDEVDLILESPSGRLLELTTNNGGAGRNYTNTCFTPDAMTPISSGVAPFTGSFLPEGDWQELNGGKTNGTWKLYAKDDQNGTVGTFINWSITFNPLYSLSYEWTPAEGLSCADCPNPKAAPDNKTEYTLAIIDTYGCMVRDDIIVSTNNDTLDIPINCVEETPNSITLGWDTSPDIATYEVNIDGQGWIAPSGMGTHLITNLPDDLAVSIQVRGTGPCMNVKGAKTCTTLPCTPPDAGVNRIIEPTCVGVDDGRIDLEAFKDNIVFILERDTNSRFTDLAPGNYQISTLDTITSCMGILDVTVPAPDTIKLDTFSIDASCGEEDGLAAISISGGTAPYEILWDVGVGEDTIKNRAPGTYTVKVTDDFDCVAEQMVTIGEDKTPVSSTINVFCAATTSNSISFEWDPVPDVFQYEVKIGDGDWSEPSDATSILVPNLSILESVEISVRGASDCITAMGSETCMTTDCTPPTGSFDQVIPGVCMDYTDGVLSVASTSPNLIYILDVDTSLTGDFDKLSPGNFRIQLYDTLTACNAYIDTILINQVLLEVDTFKTIASCGLDDAMAAVTIQGGTAPYSVLWENGMVTDTIKDLSPGIYTVEVMDDLGCVVNLSVTIEEDLTPDNIDIPITCDETVTSITFAWDSIPSIDLYEVQIGDDAWSAPSSDTSITISGLADMESVTIRVRASNSCIIAMGSTTCTTTTCISPDASIDRIINPSCVGENDGRIDLLSNEPNVIFILDQDTSINNMFENLAPGDYEITAVDTITTCNILLNAMVIAPDTLRVDTFFIDASCGEADGLAAISVSGGTAPYDILWAIGVGVDTIKNQAPGTYTVQVTDDLGCTVEQTVTIGEDDTTTSTDLNIFCAETTSSSVTFEWDPVPGINLYEVQIGEEDWNDPSAATSILVPNLNILESVQIRVRGANDCIMALDSMTCTTSDCTPPTGSFDQVSAGVCADYTDGALSVTSSALNLIYILDADTSLVGEFNNLSPGDYRVQLYDTITACNLFIDTTLINHAIIEIDSFKTIASCGLNDAIAAVTPKGGMAPYSILWETGIDTDTIKDLSAGIYDVAVTDALGCVANFSITIEGDVTPVAVNLPITCIETTNSSVTFAWDPIPGLDTYEVQIREDAWSAPSTETRVTVSGLSDMESVQIRVRASNQCLTVLDSMTCTAENCLIPTGDFNIVRAGLCAGYTDGVIAVNSTSLNLVYILGTDTSTTGMFSDLTPGDYSIVLLDTLTDCSNILDTTLAEVLPLSVELFDQPENCGATDGIAAVSPSGGTAPYQVIWGTGETGDTIKNLSAETYTATIIDANGCTTSRDIIVGITIDNLTDLRVQVSCPKVTNNSIDVTWQDIPTILDYEVQVNNGEWTSPNRAGQNHQLTDLSFSEVFDIKVRGTSDCGGAVIGNQICATSFCLPLIAATSAVEDISCYGLVDGEISIVTNTSPFMTSATLPFVVRDSAGFNVVDYTQDSTVFLVSPTSGFVVLGSDTFPATEANPMVTFKNLGAGEKTVTFWDDSFSCNSSQEFTIIEPDTFDIITTFIGEVSCAGLEDALFASSIVGGTRPFSYTLNGEPTNSEVNPNLAAGDYEFFAVDDSGCEARTSFTIGDAPALIDTTYTQNLGCGETASGIAAIVTPLTDNYRITWDNGAIGDTISNLAAGMYKGYITTDAGCTDSVQIELTDVDYTIEVDRNNPLCANEDAVPTASAFVTITGNTIGNYVYEWSDPNNQTTDTAFALAPGDYTVTVTDMLTGCTKEEMVFIVAPNVIAIDNIQTPETCVGLGDGSVIFDIQGGGAGYTYDWGDNILRTDPGRNDLTAGDYTVTITDTNGCLIENSFTVMAPENIEIAFTVDSISCANSAGSATAVATGGTGAYSYQWNDPNNQTNITATDLSESTFEVIVTDDNTGCNATATVSIGSISPLAISTNSTPSFCSESATGTATVTITGGAGTYRILWDDPAAQETVTAENLTAGDYMVLVLDDSGCEESQLITVADEGNTMEINFSKQDISCNGSANGMAEAIVTGNGANYSYNWSTGSQSRSLENLPSGEYMLTVSDDNGCSSSSMVVIEEPNLLTGIVEEQQIRCEGQNNGQIEIFAEGGTAPYSYSINGSNFTESQNFPNLGQNIYRVAIKDSNNCEEDLGSVSIIEPAAISVVLDRQLITDSGTSLSINSDVQNGQGDINYSWASDGEQASIICDDCSNPLVEPNFGQAYTVTVTDEMGCTATSSINILVKQTRSISVPTGFSPNADSFNDLLTVHGTAGTQILTFKLFDRWGELVYENNNFPVNDRTIGWDGTFRGTSLNSGVFTWVAEVQYIDGTVEVTKGHTTLVK